jgi:hypothetical protein
MKSQPEPITLRREIGEAGHGIASRLSEAEGAKRHQEKSGLKSQPRETVAQRSPEEAAVEVTIGELGRKRRERSRSREILSFMKKAASNGETRRRI